MMKKSKFVTFQRGFYAKDVIQRNCTVYDNASGWADDIVTFLMILKRNGKTH